MTQAVMPPPPPPPPSPKPVIENVKVSDIKIGNRLRKKPTDIESLAASIIRSGLLHPISVTLDNTLIGGYRRLKAFEYLGRTEIPCIVADPTINRTQAEYDENVERADFALEDIAEIYKLVQSSRIGHRSKKEEDVDDDNNKVGKLPTFSFPKGPSDIVTGKIVGHSEQDVNKIVKLVDASKENPELQQLVDKVDNRKLRLNTAYGEMIRSQDRDKPKPAPPPGQYDILYVDPPWSYDFSAVRGNPNDHYATMTDEEIMQMAVPTADNAILFLWVPYPKNREAFDIINAWGFKYKSKIIWEKDRIGTGHYVRAKHEELFICVKGDGLGIPAEADRPPSVVFADRTEHSKKPELFYEIIEKMYPGRTYIEMFGRGKAREGWKTWGLEATTTTEE